MERRDFLKLSTAPIVAGIVIQIPTARTEIFLPRPTNSGISLAYEIILNGKAKEFSGFAVLVFDKDDLSKEFRMRVDGAAVIPVEPVTFVAVPEKLGRLHTVRFTAFVNGVELGHSETPMEELSANGGDITLMSLAWRMT